MWAQGLTGPEMTPFYAAFLFALVAAMVRGRQIWALAAAAGVWLGALLLGPFFGVDWSVGRVASATIGLLITLGIGAFVRRRGESRRIAGEEAQARHPGVITAERLRIARDLHDVLGHSLSQINVQAGMGEHLIDRDPEQARRALAAIKELSRTGLNEVRSVLHTMRSDAVGVATNPGDADTTATGSASAAEALANVVRHAHANQASVRIFREDTFLCIEISDDGRGTDTATFEEGDGKGNGLIGMQERTKLLHGTFAITSASGEGTHISVRLPWVGGHGRSTSEAQS